MAIAKLLPLVLAIASIALPAAAQPKDPVEEATVHFKRGTEFYDENDFRGALIEFKRAYELVPSWKILFNIGQVEMELKNYAGALAAYTRYLREGGPDVPAGRVAQVNADIERLKGRVGRIGIRTTDGAEVLVDDLSVGHAPLPEPVLVNAGRHEVKVMMAGHPPQTRVIDVAGQQELTLVLPLAVPTAVEEAPATVQQDRSPRPPSKLPMVVSWSVTGALAATAGVFAVMTYTRDSRLEELRDTYPVDKQALEDQADRRRSAALLADGFAAAALVASGVSLYLTLTRPATKEAPRTALRVTPTGAALVGHF